MATNEIVVPSNPADLKKIKAAVVEISDAMTRIDSEKEFIKDVVDNLSEEYNLPKKYVNKLARTYHKNTFEQETAQMDDFETLYTAVTAS